MFRSPYFLYVSFDRLLQLIPSPLTPRRRSPAPLSAPYPPLAPQHHLPTYDRCT